MQPKNICCLFFSFVWFLRGNDQMCNGDVFIGMGMRTTAPAGGAPECLAIPATGENQIKIHSSVLPHATWLLMRLTSLFLNCMPLHPYPTKKRAFQEMRLTSSC